MKLPISLPQSWRPAGDTTNAKAAPVTLPPLGDPDAQIACEHCDTLHRHEVIALGGEAHCTRCDIKLYRNQSGRLPVLLSLVVTGLTVYIVANISPTAEMSGGGNRHATTLWGAIVALYDYDILFAAVLAVLTTVFFSLMYMSVLVPLFIAGWCGRQHPAAALVLHAAAPIRLWAMVEISILGVVMAPIKVVRTVSLEADAGLWVFAALTMFLTVALSIDLRPFWREIGLMLPSGSQVDVPTGMDAAARPGEDRP